MWAAGIAFFAVVAVAGIAYAGAAKHWLCRKCGKRVSKEGMPSLSGCPEGGTHSWVIDY
ncbi:MAG: hypothetical protein II954_06015 [Synergistaceae bacterium]|nr:hypothetical protein [Synergistaceae bacterium]